MGGATGADPPDPCASCGAPWVPGDRFCGACGAPAPAHRGLQWKWVMAATGAIIGAQIGVGILSGVCAALTGRAVSEPLLDTLMMGLYPLVGVLFGYRSPGLTQGEPAVGAALSVAVNGILMACGGASPEDAKGTSSVTNVFAPLIIAYTLTSLGARGGEALQRRLARGAR